MTRWTSEGAARLATCGRRYDFDARHSRLIDRWWPLHDERQAVTQSLRCYAPANLALLLEGSRLTLAAVEPGGAMDYAEGVYRKRAALGQAMQYTAKVALVS